MISDREKLAMRVAAVNAANGAAWDLYHSLRDVFAPLVGEQVCKKDGGLLAKVERLLPSLPNSRELVVYRHPSEYHLAFVVRVSVIGDGSVQSHEVTVTVGTLEKGVLTGLAEPFKGRSDWTVKEVMFKREAYWGAKRAAEELKSTLFPFGEYET